MRLVARPLLTVSAWLYSWLMRNTHFHTNRCRVGFIAVVMLIVGATLALTCGCQQPQQKPGSDPLGAFDVLGIMRKPIRVGQTTLECMPPPLMLPKNEFFRSGLSEQLKEPVQFELQTPRQIRVHLGTGRVSFAMLKPQEYPEVASSDTCEIMAVGINNAGKTYRQGLIITAPKSSIKTVADTKGKRFHFMPLGDLLNEAAMGAMLDAGIPAENVDKGILGLGLDTTHISSLEVAKSVALEGNVAGVIDESDYEKWPATGGSLVLLIPSKDQVRVIGKTMRVPEGPFVVSKEVDPEIREKTSNYLFKIAPDKYKLALAAMDLKGFAKPIDPKEYDAFAKLYYKLHPKPAEPTGEPASQPTE